MRLSYLGPAEPLLPPPTRQLTTPTVGSFHLRPDAVIALLAMVLTPRGLSGFDTGQSFAVYDVTYILVPKMYVTCSRVQLSYSLLLAFFLLFCTRGLPNKGGEKKKKRRQKSTPCPLSLVTSHHVLRR
jgi:hypothetical protein